MDPITSVTSSQAPKLDRNIESALAGAFKFPRPRPFADQIAALDRAHDAMLGHLEAGERQRAIDAILTNMRKLSSVAESLGAFDIDIDMGHEWQHSVIRSYVEHHLGMVNNLRCVAIDITEFWEAIPVRTKGHIQLRDEYAYTATLIDWRAVQAKRNGETGVRAVGIYEIEVTDI